MTKSESFNIQAPSEMHWDILTFSGMGLLGGRVFSSISPMAFATFGVFNAFTLAAGNELAGTTDKDWSIKKILLTINSLGLCALAAPILSSWIAVPVTQTGALTIAGTNLMLKVTQMVLVKCFKWGKAYHIAKHNQNLHKNVDDSLTLEEKQKFVIHFFENDLPPQDKEYAVSEIILPKEIKLDELTDNQVRWLHLATEKGRLTKDLMAFASELSKRFYALKLRAPRPTFFNDFEINLDEKNKILSSYWHHFTIDELVLPSDLNEITSEEDYLISWAFHYYANHLEKWKSLDLAEQFQLNECFAKSVNKRFLLYATDDKAEEKILKALHKQYFDINTEWSWYALPAELQEKLNKKFEKHEGCKILPLFSEFIEDLKRKMNDQMMIRCYRILRAAPSHHKDLSSNLKNILYSRFERNRLPLTQEENSYLNGQFLTKSITAFGQLFANSALFGVFNASLLTNPLALSPYCLPFCGIAAIGNVIAAKTLYKNQEKPSRMAQYLINIFKNDIPKKTSPATQELLDKKPEKIVEPTASPSFGSSINWKAIGAIALTGLFINAWALKVIHQSETQLAENDLREAGKAPCAITPSAEQVIQQFDACTTKNCIRKVFHNAAKTYHPDKIENPMCGEKLYPALSNLRDLYAGN